MLSILYSIFYLAILSQYNLNLIFLLPFVWLFGVAPATSLGAVTGGIIALLLTLLDRFFPKNRYLEVKLITALLPGIGLTIFSFNVSTRPNSGSFYGFLPLFIYTGATIWMGWKLQNNNQIHK